jgi:hypothetical protein
MSSQRGALGLWSKLSEIAGDAEAEALRCSRVLVMLDLTRAKACRALARRAAVLGEGLLELRNQARTVEQREQESRELASILEEASRLALGAPPPPPPPPLSDTAIEPVPRRPWS